MPTTWTRKVSPSSRAVYAPVVIVGPTGKAGEASFLLDTGTPVTIVSDRLARLLGMGEDRSEGPSRLWGPTGPDDGYRITPVSLGLMGRTLSGHQIWCHRLWEAAGVDGLVGLDLIGRGKFSLDLPWGLVEFRWN
jgi:hypothetical protein